MKADRGHATVNDYIAGFPRPAQQSLKQVRSIIRKALPGVEETISYNIPAFRLAGRNVLYLAGWKEHYSLYSSSRRLETAFKEKLARYEVSGKGTIRFPLSEPVPVKLIGDIARFRAKESAEHAKKGKSR